MPPRHRTTATGLTRTHSRTPSGGSSKVGLNLHFTQKDPIVAKNPEKPKKNGLIHERTTSPYPRTNSAHRIQSKDQVQPYAPKKVPPPNNKHNGSKHKAGFTLTSPGEEEDEEEWISSESGAATPSHDSDDEDSVSTNRETQLNATAILDIPQPDLPEESNTPPTPKAEFHLSRISTARPQDSIVQLPPAAQLPPPPRTPPPAPPSAQELFDHKGNADAVREAMVTRSATTSPTHRAHRHHNHKRQSVTRPPSTHSVSTRSDVALRPHPLIRGQSYGINAVTKPSPLAPLTVSGAAQAQISTSPPFSAQSGLSTSPSSIKTTSGAPSSPDAYPLNSGRRTSVSSAKSVATLPASTSQPARGAHDRTRTLSTISSSPSSSFAALSSLAHLPTASRPATPQRVSYFPPPAAQAHADTIHPLLPPPYTRRHMTLLAYRPPMRESFDRVTRAKQSR